jgi:hypothetical protein
MEEALNRAKERLKNQTSNRSLDQKNQQEGKRAVDPVTKDNQKSGNKIVAPKDDRNKIKKETNNQAKLVDINNEGKASIDDRKSTIDKINSNQNQLKNNGKGQKTSRYSQDSSYINNSNHQPRTPINPDVSNPNRRNKSNDNHNSSNIPAISRSNKNMTPRHKSNSPGHQNTNREEPLPPIPSKNVLKAKELSRVVVIENNQQFKEGWSLNQVLANNK